MYQDIDVSGRTKREIDRMPMLEAMIPALEKLNDDLTDLTAKAMPWLTKQITDLTNAILHPSGAAKAIADGAKKIATSIDKFYDSTMLPATKAGEKPVSALALGAGGYRLGETLRDRFDEWMSKFTGLPMSAVPAAGPSQSSPVAHGHISRHPAVIPPRAPVTPLAPRPPAATAGGSKPTAANIPNSVQIDSITIQTRATDANGIAGGIQSALQRKLLAAGAERGLA
jgi:hypothetical protein